MAVASFGRRNFADGNVGRHTDFLWCWLVRRVSEPQTTVASFATRRHSSVRMNNKRAVLTSFDLKKKHRNVLKISYSGQRKSIFDIKF